MPNMSILLSEYPRVSVPSLDSITNAPVRDAVAERLRVMNEVLEGHRVNGTIRSGQPLPDDMPATEVARLILASDDAANLIAASVEAYHQALAENRDAWRADAEKRLAKTKANAVKTLRAALDAINEYEITSGTLDMVNADTAELKWKAPAEVFELGVATQAMASLVDKFTAGADQ